MDAYVHGLNLSDRVFFNNAMIEFRMEMRFRAHAKLGYPGIDGASDARFHELMRRFMGGFLRGFQRRLIRERRLHGHPPPPLLLLPPVSAETKTLSELQLVVFIFLSVFMWLFFAAISYKI